MVKKVFDNHASSKQKTVRANNGPFMTKALRKAIMKLSRLRCNFNKERSEENLKAFKRKRNEFVKLLHRTKLQFYKNLDLNDIPDNRKFWKAVKPLSLEKCKLTLVSRYSKTGRYSAIISKLQTYLTISS